MSLRLIINADDFGFSSAVTDGILLAHNNGDGGGVLTSTTLMTTMPDRDRAIDLAGQTPTLGVGIHLSLTQGTPLTHCKKILTPGGDFIRSLPKLFFKLLNPDARLEAEAELFAQINYAQSRGLQPTHVDSHKHVCHLPFLHFPLINACKAAGIKNVRTCREIKIPNTPKLPIAYRPLVKFAHKLAARLKTANLQTNDWFFGLATTGKTITPIYQAIAKFAPHLPPNSTGELMTHPGHITDLTRYDTRLLQQREQELAALTDPSTRTALTTANIQLVHYGRAE